MEHKERVQEVENLEKKAKFTIISLDDDEGNHEKKKILNDAKEEMARLYMEFRLWLNNNLNSDEAIERLERLKQETNNLINRTKENVAKFNERENVIAGKAKAKALKTKVVETMNVGISEVKKNEHVSKVVNTLNGTMDNVRSDERVVEGVKKFKKETLKIAESAFNGLKRVLDTNDDHKDDQKG